MTDWTKKLYKVVIGIELEYLNGSIVQCSVGTINLKLQIAMSETCDIAPHPSVHDEGGVRYMGMGEC